MRINRRSVHRRVDAGAQYVAVNRPRSAEHEACDCNAAEEMLGTKFTGGFPADGIRTAIRTGTHTHLHAAHNNSTKPLFDVAPGIPGSISQRHRASLRRVLVKCGLNAGGSVASATAWNYCGIYPCRYGTDHDIATFSSRASDTNRCRGLRVWCRGWSTTDPYRALRADPVRDPRSMVPSRQTSNDGWLRRAA